MGCSLFKVGALPTWTDWEVNGEREKKMAGTWMDRVLKRSQKNKSIRSIVWLVAKPLVPELPVLHLLSFTLLLSTDPVYSCDCGRCTIEILDSNEPIGPWFQNKADFSFIASNHLNDNSHRHILSAVASKLIRLMLVSWVGLIISFWLMFECLQLTPFLQSLNIDVTQN